MNWTIEVIYEPASVYIDASGHAEVKECRRMLDELLSSELWKPGTPLLIDCRKVSVRELHYEEIDLSGMIIQSREAELGHTRMAIVASPGLGYGIGRQFKIMTEAKTNLSVEIFEDEQSAKNWLSQWSD
jgi:hypothetical protein